MFRKGKYSLGTKLASFMIVVGLLLLLIPVNVIGADPGIEEGDGWIKYDGGVDDGVTHTADGCIITGVLIKAGLWGDSPTLGNGKYGYIENDDGSITYWVKEGSDPAPTELAYQVSGVGTSSATVTRLGGSNKIQDISHITFYLDCTNPPDASVIVNKVDNEGNALDGAVIGIFSANGDSNSEVQKKTSSGGSVTFDGLDLDTTYYVHEISAPDGYTPDSGWYEVKTSSSGSAVTLGQSIVNNPDVQYGSIKIDKTTTGGLYGTFNFTVTQQNVDNPYTTSVSITVPEGGPYTQSAAVGNLPAGDYLVTETGGDASASFSLPAGQTVNVTVGATSEVDFTNTPNTAEGQVTITKNIGGALDSDITFYFDINPNVTGISEPIPVVITAGNTSGSYGPFEVPFGTEFTISEVSIPDGWSLSSSSNNVFTLSSDNNSINSVFTNTPDTQNGSININKTTTGGLTGTFHFEVYDADGNQVGSQISITITEAGNYEGSASVSDLEPGNYTVKEVGSTDASASFTLAADQTVTVAAGSAVDADFTNSPDVQYGSIKINKTTTGGLYGTFNFTVTQQNVDNPYTTSVSITVPEGGPYTQSATVGNLPAGDYLVTETGGDASASFSLPAGQTVNVTVGATSEVDFTNTPDTQNGSININKTTTGGLTGTFHFEVYDADGNQVGSQISITITEAGNYEGSASVSDLEPGNYTVKEVGSTDASASFTLAADQSVTVAAGSAVDADFTNSPDINEGQVTITKNIGEALGEAITFYFTITPDVEGISEPIAVTITAGETTGSFGPFEVPFDTEFEIDETNIPAGWVLASSSGNVFTLTSDNDTANAEFTNDYSEGYLIIDKSFLDEQVGSGTFGFEIYGSETGGTAIASTSITITNGSGGSKTIYSSELIPGETYYVEEVSGPGTNTIPGSGRVAIVATSSAGTANTAYFVNDIGGSIVINKSFTGGVASSGTFRFGIYDAATGGNQIDTASISITDGTSGTVTVSGLILGQTYYVEELTGPGTNVVPGPGSRIEVVAAVDPGTAATADFENDPGTGSITVHKLFGTSLSTAVASPAVSTPSFTFSINTDPAQTATITGEGTATFTGLVAGNTYTVTETTTGYSTYVSYTDGGWTPGITIGAEVEDGEDTDVYFLNDTVIDIPGSITVHKILGDDVDADTVFNFSINTVPAQNITIQGAGTATFSNIDPGTYTITETTTGFTTSVSYDGTSWTGGNAIGAIVSGGDDTDVYFLNEEEVEVAGISEPSVIEVLGISEELPYTGYNKWYYVMGIILVLGGVILIQWFRRKEQVEYFV